MQQYLPPLTARGRHWARFVLIAAAILLLLWIAFLLRTVLTPLLAALALAYIFNPLITHLQRWHIRRIVSVTLLYIVMTTLLLTAGVVLTGRVISQATDLRDQFPVYVDAATDWLRRNPYLQPADVLSGWVGVPSAASAPASQEAPAVSSLLTSQPASAPATDDFWLSLKPVIREHGLAALNATVAFMQKAFFNAYTLLALLVLVPMYTFFFLWRFNDIVAAVRAHLPAAYRDGIVHVCRTIDQAIADFFRGRLVVCVLIGLCLGMGWQMIGLKKGLLLGLFAGVLNLVPFMSVFALIPALFLAFTQAASAGHPWAAPVLLTMGVFVAVQALESFALSPLIESQANGLHPITTVVALLIGAEAAGLLGMLLAIPVASTLKTLATQFLLPPIRRLATADAPQVLPFAAPLAVQPPVNDAVAVPPTLGPTTRAPSCPEDRPK